MSEPSKVFQSQLSAPENSQATEESTTLTTDKADQTYNAKAEVLNRAIQEIGMGRYQWQLFVVIGFGWANQQGVILTLAQNIGLLIGAVSWGFGCDIFGRTLGFNLTIGVTAVFALVAAGSPNFAAICVFAALWSIGVGGNLPVDSATFLEFLPGSHQYLLTVLSIDWALAQVLANLVAWPLLGDMTCSSADGCTKAKNMGWRYYMITMGGLGMLMFVVRFVFFTIYESPKYLMGKGQNGQAVKVVHEVARRNGGTSTLSQDDLDEFDRSQNQPQVHIRALFNSPKQAYSTTLTILVWAFIGLGYPLYNAFLPYITAQRGASYGDGSTYLTYRNSLIIAVMGVQDVFLAEFWSNYLALDEKALCPLSLLASTTASSSNSLLGWNCAFNFMSSLMYAVLYAYTPEIFLTKDRGTGNALTASANRIFGIMSPIIAIFANLETAVPVYVSGALFISAGILVTLMPYESRGKASL
ncbi:Sugar transporter [Penicillium malachiteum]|uniref:Sugar transporter n=1 Tax=Penicillium malachiteum TaxID=1324776 RepID=UPI0025493D97|nr:Sugar transporter [Penicillium malachiteum]KAJ5730930.1 Sugar transporter [Penicillium malachiteum]